MGLIGHIKAEIAREVRERKKGCRLEHSKCVLPKKRRKEPFLAERMDRKGIAFDQCSFCYYSEYGYSRTFLERLKEGLPNSKEELKLLKGLLQRLLVAKEPGLITSLWGNSLATITVILSVTFPIMATLYIGSAEDWSKELFICFVVLTLATIMLSFSRNQRRSIVGISAQKEYLLAYLSLVEEKLQMPENIVDE